jgi:hypothetical protein
VGYVDNTLTHEQINADTEKDEDEDDVVQLRALPMGKNLVDVAQSGLNYQHTAVQTRDILVVHIAFLRELGSDNCRGVHSGNPVLHLGKFPLVRFLLSLLVLFRHYFSVCVGIQSTSQLVKVYLTLLMPLRPLKPPIHRVNRCGMTSGVFSQPPVTLVA